MDRKEFLTSVGRLGVCSCVGIALMTPKENYANQEDTNAAALKQSISFAQRRFAKLIEILGPYLEASQKTEILQQLGRSCSQESASTFNKYQNNLEGFLSSIKEQWAEKVEYNKTEKRVTIYGKKMEQCFCPLADKTVTPTDLCECSIGWQKNTFETIIGRPVTARVEESILRGGQRCTFSVNWT